MKKSLIITHTDASKTAFNTLKDQSINVSDFVRKALIKKAAEVTADETDEQ